MGFYYILGWMGEILHTVPFGDWIQSLGDQGSKTTTAVPTLGILSADNDLSIDNF